MSRGGILERWYADAEPGHVVLPSGRTVIATRKVLIGLRAGETQQPHPATEGAQAIQDALLKRAGGPRPIRAGAMRSDFAASNYFGSGEQVNFGQRVRALPAPISLDTRLSARAYRKARRMVRALVAFLLAPSPWSKT
jgi:hypothetical protein